MQTELIQLAIAVVVLALVLVLMRRAAAKSRAKSSAGVRERLGVEEAEPPMGGLCVVVLAAALALGIDVIARATRPAAKPARRSSFARG